ncbi:diguanylate cyclase (GGDEF) domain-containing protein [Oribacterium sp. KHPX15]|uniref:EAL domain-containing protein n=1 Tax=Oribacterium sp. KHPX15 TaxID=1855342 RepID=UPI00089A9B70|nr:EAL domain-containing protein [Oribacterium sp. KHPX15]SEA50143.1 diguanylate cyclase (GGDEF) domain-containing protein [Oribacterium sp. KHPX15]
MGNFDLEKYIVECIDDAISKGWIKVFFQPLIRGISRKVSRFEALSRWQDPEHGLIMPEDFIYVLEEHGLIYKLDGYVIEESCRQFRNRINEGKKIVPFSVNLSRKDFELCDIFEVVEASVKKYEISREFVIIELNEDAFNQDTEKIKEKLDRFRNAGYQICMDDFGVGYSSLNIFKDFEIDEIKIDMKFLRDFSPKACRIVASVVDMAKEIGILTIAEGVETEEQSRFLGSIGCEMIQGFLFCKPLPVEDCMKELSLKGIEIEHPDEVKYFDEVGSINILSPASLTRVNPAGNTDMPVESAYESVIPYAMVEYDGNSFRYLYRNAEYLKTLKVIGYEDDDLNDISGDSDKRKLRKAIEETTELGSCYSDFTINGYYCYFEARVVARNFDRCAILFSLTNSNKDGKKVKLEKLDASLKHLYGIYNSVSMLDLDKNFLEVLYLRDSEKRDFESGNIEKLTKQFAENYVYEADRNNYLNFFDTSTLKQRIKQTDSRFINAYIRTKTLSGDYTWKIYLAVLVASDHALVFIRNADNIKSTELSAYQNYMAAVRSSNNLGSELTKELLWDNLNRNTSLGVFWKDKQRRFVGANKKFMDYYGFRSQSDFIGKTDEEMGWHVAPEPYKRDEYRVLREGAVTLRVPGRCIAHGSIRDIRASKMPVYDNGRIIGLIGYFEDVTEVERDRVSKFDIQETDNLTGLLNTRGMMAAVSSYKDEYDRRGVDFAELYFSIDNYQDLISQYGHAFGDEILYAVGKKLAASFGTSATLVRYSGDDFLAFTQSGKPGDIEKVANKIRKLIMDINNVNGYSCTLHPSVGIVRYSEVKDLNEMHRVGFNRMSSERLKNKKKS